MDIISTNIFKSNQSGFKSQRQKAENYLQEMPVPGKKTEDYKYTLIASALLKDFPELKSTNESSLHSLENIKLPSFDSYKLILINGVYQPELSNVPQSIGVTELTDENPGASATLGKIALTKNDFFVSLNTIQFNSALMIDVPESLILDKPVSIINLIDGIEDRVLCSPRIIISLGQNSKTSFYEFFTSLGENVVFRNNVMEIFVGKAASGVYSLFQLDNENASSHNSTFIHQEGNSNFNSITITTGGKMVRNNLNYILNDKHIESHLYGLYLPNKDQVIDNHTVVDHRKPESYSNELYKGILKDKAKCVFNGKIYVRPDAQKTNAYQSNKNILLSDDAIINTKPQLEIWADDVKCSHGCTTGQLDEEQIFYLRSRGIDKNTAIAMVLNAFQHDIINKIDDEEVRNFVDKLVSNKIGMA